MRFNVPSPGALAAAQGGPLTCFKLLWPDTPEYRAMLGGLLWQLTRGRSYDERTGFVRDAQSVGYRLFEANFPLNACSDSPNTPPITGGGGCGGGVVILDDEGDMGSVVTNVTIEGGVLYVWFGECCKRAVGSAADLVSETDRTSELPADLQPSESNDVRCQKANVIASILWDMCNILETSSPTLNRGAFADLYDAYPGVSFDRLDLIAAYTSIEVLGATTPQFEAGTPALQSYICNLAAGLDNSWGVSASDYLLMKSELAGALGLLERAVAHGMIDAVGPGDWNELVLERAVLEGTYNCDCPDLDNYYTLPGGMTWAYDINFLTIDGGFSNSEVGHGWSAGRGWYSDNIVRDNIGGGNWTLARPARNSDASGTNRKLVYLKQWHGELPAGATHYRNPAEVRIGGTVLGGYQTFPIPATFELTIPGGGASWGNNTGLSINWNCTFDAGEVSGNMTVTRLVIAGTGTPPYANLTNILV